MTKKKGRNQQEPKKKPGHIKGVTAIPTPAAEDGGALKPQDKERSDAKQHIR